MTMLCFGARGRLPLRYVRDLRPLTAIPLDAIPASLHTPLRGTPLRRSVNIADANAFESIIGLLNLSCEKEIIPC